MSDQPPPASHVPHRAYAFRGVQCKHRDFASEAEAVAALEAVRDLGDGWDGWTEPAPLDELPKPEQEG